MYLSELAYECVRMSSGDVGSSLGYADFCDGKAQGDSYLSSSAGRVFGDINAFFGLAVQMEKLPARCEGFDLSGKGPDGLAIPLSGLSFKPNVVKAVFQYANGNDYVSIPWEIADGKIRIGCLPYRDGRKVWVEYRISLPMFSFSDIVPLTDNGDGTVTDGNIELSDVYGIPNEIYPICVTYVSALQNMESNQALAVLQKRDAESYLQAVKTYETLHLPKSVRKVHRI